MSEKIETFKISILQKRQNQVLLQETQNQFRALSESIVSGTAGKGKRRTQGRRARFKEAVLTFDAVFSAFITAAALTQCTINVVSEALKKELKIRSIEETTFFILNSELLSSELFERSFEDRS